MGCHRLSLPFCKSTPPVAKLEVSTLTLVGQLGSYNARIGASANAYLSVANAASLSFSQR